MAPAVSPAPFRHRHQDSPSLWVLVVAGSLILHVLLLTVLRFVMVRVAGQPSSGTATPVEVEMLSEGSPEVAAGSAPGNQPQSAAPSRAAQSAAPFSADPTVIASPPRRATRSQARPQSRVPQTLIDPFAPPTAPTLPQAPRQRTLDDLFQPPTPQRPIARRPSPPVSDPVRPSPSSSPVAPAPQPSQTPTPTPFPSGGITPSPGVSPFPTQSPFPDSPAPTGEPSSGSTGSPGGNRIPPFGDGNGSLPGPLTSDTGLGTERQLSVTLAGVSPPEVDVPSQLAQPRPTNPKTQVIEYPPDLGTTATSLEILVVLTISGEGKVLNVELLPKSPALQASPGINRDSLRTLVRKVFEKWEFTPAKVKRPDGSLETPPQSNVIIQAQITLL